MIDKNGIEVDVLPYNHDYTYIVSDTMRNAQALARKLNLTQSLWIYLYNNNQLDGLHNATVYLTGRYWQLSDWNNIQMRLLVSDHKIIAGWDYSL